MRYLLIIILFSISCASQHNQHFNGQGVKGKVLWLEGDFMPGPGQTNQPEPVSKDIYIYPQINTDEVDDTGPFYSLKEFKPVKIVISDENGMFSVGLPQGMYSIFTKEPDGYFASVQDGKGNINPVEVVKGEFTEIIIEVNYKAVY